MQTDVAKKLFTADEYYRMWEVGILRDEEDRVELIDGEIVRMSPLGNWHMACVDRATEIFVSALKGKVIVSIQSAVQISNLSVPQPDLVVLKHRDDYYSSRRRVAGDIILFIEVSDTTLRFDRNVKLPLYAAARIPEVWIEDLRNRLLLVHRDPEGTAYQTCISLRPGDSVSPQAFPDLVIPVGDLLG